MDRSSAQAKLLEYQGFVETILRPQLLEAKSLKQKSQQEIAEYEELLATLQQHQTATIGSKKKEHDAQLMQVDLGHGKVFCQAEANLESTIFIHVGMGFHVELTLVEGIVFVQKRLKYLDQVLRHRQTKLQKIQEHVTSSEIILDELSRNLQTL